MPLFRYTAVTPDGEVRKGQMEDVSREAVILRIQRAGQIPVQADQIGAGINLLSVGRLFHRRRLGQREIAGFTQALAVLIQARVPLDRALEIMLDVEDDQRIRALTLDVQSRVREGKSLSAALEAQNLFSRFYINMVQTGEASGGLDVALTRLVEYLDRRQQLRSQVTSALLYPIILLAVAGISVIVILTYVVPQFEPLFADLGPALPASTRMVLGAAELLTAYGWILVLGLAAAFFYLRYRLSIQQYRSKWDRRLLSISLVGPLIRKLETARFSRSLGTLLQGGVPVLSSLSIAKQTVTNSAMAESLDAATARLQEGGDLAEPLIASKLFPKLAVQMVKVGEETGRLDEMLLNVADVYDREVATSVQRLLSILEPLLIIGLGIVIAAIIMSILVGIVSVNELPM